MTRAYIGRFPTAEALQAAVLAVRGNGLSIDEVLSPHPLAIREDTSAVPHVRLPAVAAVAGALGATAILGFQWFASRRDWPLEIGGTVGGSVLSWLPVAFLVGCLCAAVAAFVGFALRPRRYANRAEHAGHFVLAISLDSPGFDWRAARALLLQHGATECGYAEVS